MEDEEIRREEVAETGVPPQTIEEFPAASVDVGREEGKKRKKNNPNRKKTAKGGEAKGKKRTKDGGTNETSVANPGDDPPLNISSSAKTTVATAPTVTVLQGARLALSPAQNPVSPRREISSAPVTTASSPLVKVHRVEAVVKEVKTEIIPDKVVVQGRVGLQIFFVTGDERIHHAAEEVPFSTILAVPGARPGMTSLVEARVAAVLFHLGDDGLTLIKKVILEIFVKVTDRIQQSFLPGNGPLLLFDEVIGEATAQALVEDEVILAIPAVKIEEIAAELKEITAEVIRDKVIVQGRIHQQIFFFDPAGLARHQAEEVPFTVAVELPGAAPGMKVEIHPRIEKVLHELVSPTLLRKKLAIEVFAKVTTPVHFRAAFGEGPLVRVKEIIGEATGQILRREVVNLARPAQKVREIVAALEGIKTTVLPGKAIVQGVIHKQIFYIGTDDIEYHQAEEVPFSLMIEIPGLTRGAELVVEPVINSVLFNLLAPDRLEEKVLLEVRVTAVEDRQWRLALGNGPLVVAEEVVGENLGQVFLRLVNRFPFGKRVVPITVSSTVQGRQVFREQIMVEREFPLPVTAVKIAEVRAEITGLRAEIVPHGLLVEGEVVKDIKFVGEDEIVREITEEVPFSILVGIPAGFTPEAVEVQIEEILFALSPDGQNVRQVIVLLAEVTATEIVTREFQLITEVVVPGLAVATVLVEEPVVTPEGVILRQFPVITGLSGPGLAEVAAATFGVHTLNVVGVGPQDLNVLEAITLRDP